MGVNYIGVDVQKRKIWEVLELLHANHEIKSRRDESDQESPDQHLSMASFELRQEPIESATFKETFGKYDPKITWLLGNHSDELTVWIPVLARQIGCNFLTIPCCDFDFSGKKFDKNQPENKNFLQSKFHSKSNSGHLTYQEYVRATIVDVCHFSDLKEDILRIPSTKRHCFVGFNTLPEQTDFTLPWETKILPRVDPTTIKRRLPELDWRKEVESRVAFHLLGCAFELVEGSGDSKRQKSSEATDTEQTRIYNFGCAKPISEIVQHMIKVDPEFTKKLKTIRGGVKSLLLQNSQLFKVQEGKIALRDWRQEVKSKEKIAEKWKTRRCWFYAWHPQGCILDEEQCPYDHN